jgi:hypothetical protein
VLLVLFNVDALVMGGCEEFRNLEVIAPVSVAGLAKVTVFTLVVVDVDGIIVVELSP